jgi:enoyl-CoA hydratase/carnithine racemase
MATLETYIDRFRFAELKREGGILTIKLHSKGDSLRWGERPLQELPIVMWEVGQDPENEVVILTGSGDNFIADFFDEPSQSGYAAFNFDRALRNQRAVIDGLLNISAPMIAAVNGPAHIHSEYALLCDIVLAAENTTFQDAAHYQSGLPPGDGVQIVWPALIGINRARYFLMTGQKIDAGEALRLGVVSEVLPQADLMGRARQLADQLMTVPQTVRSLARETLNCYWRRLMQEDLAFGLLSEGKGSMQLYAERQA